ncbi:MAG: hypothetical protein ACW96S_09935, partial [Promethearchaeota archaeon]
MLDPYSLYLDEIRSFLDSYIIKPEIDLHSTSYFHLKSEILKELNKIIQELQNLNSNCSNINRLLKNGTSFLTDLISGSKNLLLKSNDIASNLINSLQETQKLYENNLHLWIELNKIKNISFKLNKIPDFLEKWDEIKELFVFVKSLNDVFIKKRKKNGQESLLTFQFDEISQYFLSKDDNKSDFYTDIIYLLHSNKLIEEYQGDEFINVLERKEIIQNIQDFIRPLLT